MSRHRSLIPTHVYICLLTLLAGACASTSRMGGALTPAAAIVELRSVAKSHNLSIWDTQVLFVTDGTMTIAHAPIVGIERYTVADFARGAPIQAILIYSRNASNPPPGSYLVKAQFQPGAAVGKVQFIAANGTVV